jgi:heme/copper-type cytochrome/quinol oxidase subunit 3
MGMVFFLMSELFLFGSLFWTYYYLRGYSPGWPPHHPDPSLAIINTFILLTGSVVVWWGYRGIQKGRGKVLSAALAIAATLGAVFLLLTFWEWAHEDFGPATDAYGSIFYMLTGFHALHVLGGVLLMLALLSRSLRHGFSPADSKAVEAGSLYWHFVDLVWLIVFTTIFIVR